MNKPTMTTQTRESWPDFHARSSSEVEALLARADAERYRKPKNANGSRARYYYEYLKRKARRH